MLTKAQQVFDATTPANGDAVAAYIYASNRLTSAAIAGNESLRTIAALQDGAGTALTSTLASGKQSLDINIASITAPDMHVDGTVADSVADADNPVKIGSRAHTGLLTAVADGVRADVLADLYRRPYFNDAPQVGNKITQTPIGLTAAKIVASNMGGRMRFLAQNNGGHAIWLGVDNTVTADAASTGGFIIPAHGGTLELPSGDGIAWWAISDTAAQKLIVVELG